MTERLLHFIWRLQYFDKRELTTLAGEPLQILSAGEYNSNQGPDFHQARIRVRQTTWAGNIELHLKTSDWDRHRHQHDRNYENVILHVVWQHDRPGNTIPVLELENRVSKLLLQRYEALMHTSQFIPCEKMIGSVKEMTWLSWKDRLLAGRLERKAEAVKAYLKENKGNWEESFWWMLARNFGARVNAAAFEEIARSLPVNLLARHKSQIQQLEALLFGQAGLLKEKLSGDDYYRLLQKEYRFLQEKYSLEPIRQPVHFLRMRPGNFPTIRLAQLAALIQNSAHLFSRIKETGTVKEIRILFQATANDYWHYHYRFGEAKKYKEKNTGEDMINNILINTITPVLFAYGSYHKEPRYKDKAVTWLEKTFPENNSITRGFAELGVANKNAFDSQALLELKNEYCDKKRCLECGVGSALLKS